MLHLPPFGWAAEVGPEAEIPQTQIQAGELSVTFRDNSESPRILSGVDQLVHTTAAPGFDAFDPNDPGSSAGLNFEHIISGHSDPANWFAPRHGLYRLQRGSASNSVVLRRKATDEPWALESSLKYKVVAPQAIDFEFEFRCRPQDARRFGKRRYAVLFWADYMNDVEDVALHFRGVNGPGGAEQWISASAPTGHSDYVGGGTYRNVAAAPLEYDADHNLKLNLQEYEAWRKSLPASGTGPASANAPALTPGTPAVPGAERGPSNLGWRLPPLSRVSRTMPRLVNYFHMDLADGGAQHKEERLVQWNVVILNHDLVAKERLSLARMRETNPHVTLLAWIPLQGPNEGLSRGVPAKGSRDWYARTADGTYLRPHWGGNLMSVCAQDHAWLKHVLNYVRQQCLQLGGYDGLMLDCLWPTEPASHDANGDGVHDARDTAAWQEGMLFLLRHLRAEFPKAILIGNGGVPWPADCPYYEFANGCMHENALGDQFGGTEWQALWDGYRTSLSKVSARPAYHFIQADVRADGRNQATAARLRTLTENDHRRLRLGLATSLLLDGGCFGFDRGDCLHGQLWWFEDYDVDLGTPLGAYVEGRYGRGTFARDFERGLVVVNPTETTVSIADQTTLPDGHRQAGTEAIVVPPFDARILARAVPSVLPNDHE